MEKLLLEYFLCCINWMKFMTKNVKLVERQKFSVCLFLIMNSGSFRHCEARCPVSLLLSTAEGGLKSFKISELGQGGGRMGKNSKIGGMRVKSV